MSIKANLQALTPAWDEFKRQQCLPTSIPQSFAFGMVTPDGGDTELQPFSFIALRRIA